MSMIIGIQTDLKVSVCDAAVQCDLLCPPMTSTPKKGEIAPAIEDADPFVLTEEESETDITESTIYRETTTSEDEEQIPVEKQLTFLVFESALMLLFATSVA